MEELKRLNIKRTPKVLLLKISEKKDNPVQDIFS